MAGHVPRYRIVLVEDYGVSLPVRYQPPRRTTPVWIRRSDPLQTLMEAFLQLSFRGEGAESWAPALGENPLTFLLDAVSDGVVVRAETGEPVYANPAARRLELLAVRPREALEILEVGNRRYERRSMAFRQNGETLLLEVVHRLED